MRRNTLRALRGGAWLAMLLMALLSLLTFAPPAAAQGTLTPIFTGGPMALPSGPSPHAPRPTPPIPGPGTAR